MWPSRLRKEIEDLCESPQPKAVPFQVYAWRSPGFSSRRFLDSALGAWSLNGLMMMTLHEELKLSLAKVTMLLSCIVESEDE